MAIHVRRLAPEPWHLIKVVPTASSKDPKHQRKQNPPIHENKSLVNDLARCANLRRAVGSQAHEEADAENLAVIAGS